MRDYYRKKRGFALSKDTIEFLGLWENLHNDTFKGVEFDAFKNQAGSNAFTMSPTKWIEATGAIGMVCSKLSLSWNLNREISKLNYRVHTDSIKENLIPPLLTAEQVSYTYASEADLLNTVLFGKTAKQWRDENPGQKGRLMDADVQWVKVDTKKGVQLINRNMIRNITFHNK